MNTLRIMAFILFISGCANAQTAIPSAKFDIVGDTLPAIRHMTDMKVSGDTLLFVFEGEDGYGQRILRRAVVDCESHTLKAVHDMGKRDDGYFVSFMPYPFIADNGTVRVIGQDDCEIYTVKNDTAFVKTNQYLMDENSTVPFSLSQYIQDVFMTGPDSYVFIGREPKGGRQYAMKSDLTTAKIDTIRQINISPELRSWMPNAGEMVYSDKYKRLAFAYKLHPVIEIFDLAGNTTATVRIGEDTFNPKTLEEADFDILNRLHTVDITYTPDYIYALNWNCMYADAATTAPTIYKIDWNGKIVDRYFNVPYPLYKVVAIDDAALIGWNGKDFIKILFEN